MLRELFDCEAVYKELGDRAKTMEAKVHEHFTKLCAGDVFGPVKLEQITRGDLRQLGKLPAWFTKEGPELPSGPSGAPELDPTVFDLRVRVRSPRRSGTQRVVRNSYPPPAGPAQGRPLLAKQACAWR